MSPPSKITTISPGFAFPRRCAPLLAASFLQGVMLAIIFVTDFAYCDCDRPDSLSIGVRASGSSVASTLYSSALSSWMYFQVSINHGVPCTSI